MPARKKNASKEEIAAQLAANSYVERSKQHARNLFPLIKELTTVYDAQTAVNAAAGHIKYGISVAENKLKVRDLEMDLKTGADSDVKRAVVAILGLLADEKANDIMALLDTIGSKLPQFLMNKHIKDPMSAVPLEEFIAK